MQRTFDPSNQPARKMLLRRRRRRRRWWCRWIWYKLLEPSIDFTLKAWDLCSRSAVGWLVVVVSRDEDEWVFAVQPVRLPACCCCITMMEGDVHNIKLAQMWAKTILQKPKKGARTSSRRSNNNNDNNDDVSFWNRFVPWRWPVSSDMSGQPSSVGRRNIASSV